MPQPEYKYQQWPAWFYGPEGQKKIFHRAQDVPSGWADDPNKVRKAGDEPPQNGKDAWGGYTKEELTQALRQEGVKVDARTSARKLYARCEKLGLFEEAEETEEDDDESENDESEDDPENEESDENQDD